MKCQWLKCWVTTKRGKSDIRWISPRDFAYYKAHGDSFLKAFASDYTRISDPLETCNTPIECTFYQDEDGSELVYKCTTKFPKAHPHLMCIDDVIKAGLPIEVDTLVQDVNAKLAELD